MSTTQRNAISNPTQGLTIFNTDAKCLQWYVGSGAWHDGCGDNLYLQYPEGTVFCESGPTEIVEVTNPTTGKTWMDRNLGASQVATASNDTDSYGDLYQWGRAADGHQCRTSPTINTLATTSQPNTGAAWDGHFILTTPYPFDWLQTQDNFLWSPNNPNDPSPLKGFTDPCPSGYRVPTEAELNSELSSWSSTNLQGAIASPLKLPGAGNRSHSNGALLNLGSSGLYWSSSAVSYIARILSANTANDAYTSNGYRAGGASIRCIKE
jgi:uncharacterized protein (TIGR02145 family)